MVTVTVRESGMGGRVLMQLQSLLGSDHNVRTTAEGQGQSKEQHEGVSGPCTMTKSRRARGWKPRKIPQPSQTQRNWVKKLNEFKLGGIRLVENC